ncbi:MAG: 2-dehydropantoate 2-reductase [Dehalococcoidia bacterium]|jgi:2-dehydropantoate 2-reductase|nr:2-dehydropantoate 2-reductase [Dehalococcoidia bacterium]
MKVAVIGPGSVGGYYGGVLARHGEEVSLIGRPGAHFDAIQANGLQLQTNWGDFQVHPLVTSDPGEIGPVDVVLYTVKLFQNAVALPIIKPLLKDDTIILTIQNGVDSADQIAAVYGWDHVMAGATYIETGRPEPGLIHQSGSSARIAFGEQDGSPSERTEKVQSLLQKEGIQTELATDIVATLWTKLVVVGPIGTIMTASDASFVELLECPWGEYTVRSVMEDVERVARAKGVNLAPDVVDEKLRGSIAEAADLQMSLQDDFRAGNQLEIEHLLGMVVREGRAMNVPVQASAALVTALWKSRNGAIPE